MQSTSARHPVCSGAGRVKVYPQVGHSFAHLFPSAKESAHFAAGGISMYWSQNQAPRSTTIFKSDSSK